MSQEPARKLIWRGVLAGTRVHGFAVEDATLRPPGSSLCGRVQNAPLYKLHVPVCVGCVQRAPEYVAAWHTRCTHDIEAARRWAAGFPGAEFTAHRLPLYGGWSAQIGEARATRVAVDLGWHPSSGYENVRRGPQTIDEELREAGAAVIRYVQNALAIFATWGGPYVDQHLNLAENSTEVRPGAPGTPVDFD